MRKKFMYMLNLIQLTVFTLILIANLGILISYKNLYKQAADLMDIDKNIIYNCVTIEGEEPEVSYSKINSLYKYSLDLKEKGLIKSAYKNVTGNSNIDFEGFEENFDVAIVYDEFLKRFPIEIAVGRGFTEEELKGIKGASEVPIIIGYGLKDKFNVGDILTPPLLENDRREGKYIVRDSGDLTTYTLEIKYKVIGVAKPHTMVYLGNSIPYTSSYRDDFIYMSNSIGETKGFRNNEVVFETEGREIEEEIYYSQNPIIVECYDKNEVEGVENLLNNKVEEVALEGEFVLVEDGNSEIQQYRNLFMTSLVLSSVLIFFSLTGLISLIRYTMEQRKKEFGIYLSVGATKEYIALKNMKFIGSLIGISLVLATIISKILKVIMEKYLSLEELAFYSNIFVFNKELIIGLALLFGCVFVISLIPIINKVKKYSVVELIRGK
ncbi:ABC transporter permease [Clostridium sp.]|uniref:ABC transporter permease n=1 Tax=Clostridium sp. TaxID=1506 RepID=UPI0029036D1D|nr:ABC transporter permease [Clostridium sp.]MDU2107084.1 ABC transporter permease [Clostridium sp.]MDU3353727.1 ABC transporter permease [Clostridium sp.]